MSAKIVIRIIRKTAGRGPAIEWPADWPVPREGENVQIGGDENIYEVRRVIWYPHGDPDGGTPEPYVYVVGYQR